MQAPKPFWLSYLELELCSSDRTEWSASGAHASPGLLPLALVSPSELEEVSQRTLMRMERRIDSLEAIPGVGVFHAARLIS